MGEEEALAYLDEIGKLGSIPGLDSIRGLMEELGNVQDAIPSVHVAGTNGKGSVCAMLTSILMEAGYRVGTYSSPAVFGRREQYLVNQESISGSDFAEVISQVRAACERMAAKGLRQPTVFEVETAAAFFYFYRKSCQVSVIETGMGGLEDATNILSRPRLSVITSIGMDHMAVLGGSLREIARAKAGIIKDKGRAVAALPESADVRAELEGACRKRGAALTFADKSLARGARHEAGRLCFSYGEFGELRLRLLGAYQVENAVCAIEAAKALREEGFPITDAAIRTGLENARWEGRFTILSRSPFFVIDGAHNVDAAKKLRETLEMGFTNREIIYIIGVLADKEHREMLEIMLPLAKKAFTVTPRNPRALDGRQLAREAEEFHGDVEYCATIREAVGKAVSLSRGDGAMTLAFGTLSFLADVKEELHRSGAIRGLSL